MSGETIAKSNEGKSMPDEQRFDPDRLDHLIHDYVTPRQELAIIAALRNPYTEYGDFGALTGHTPSAMKKVMQRFAHGTLGRRSGSKNIPDAREDRSPTSYEELTPKQQGMCRFFAKYPLSIDELKPSTLADVIEVVEGISVSSSYPGMFLERYDEIVREYRERMDDDEIPDEKLPDINYDALGDATVKERLEQAGTRHFPDENMDLPLEDGTPPKWVRDFRGRHAEEFQLMNDHGDFVGGSRSNQTKRLSSSELPDDFEWYCPHCDRAFPSQASFNGHFSNFDDDEREAFESKWIRRDEPLWMGALRYTIERDDLDLEIADIIPTRYRHILAHVRSNPRKSVQAVANAVGCSERDVRILRDYYTSACPEEWLDIVAFGRSTMRDAAEQSTADETVDVETDEADTDDDVDAEIELRCPVCDEESDDRLAFSSHFGTHDEKAREKALGKWSRGSDLAWVAAFYYAKHTANPTAQMSSHDDEFLEFLGEPHASIVEYVRDHPYAEYGEIIESIDDARRGQVRHVRHNLEFLVPDEWIERLEERRKAYASGTRTEFEEWVEERQDTWGDDESEGVADSDPPAARDAADAADADDAEIEETVDDVPTVGHVRAADSGAETIEVKADRSPTVGEDAAAQVADLADEVARLEDDLKERAVELEEELDETRSTLADVEQVTRTLYRQAESERKRSKTESAIARSSVLEQILEVIEDA